MTRKIKLAICLAASLGLSAGLFGALFDGAAAHFRSAQTRRVDFRRDIEPIFRANCYQCHGEKKASAQLRLDNKQLAMKGGISGAMIAPGNSKESRLMKRILGEGDEARMPLTGNPLKPAQIELIRKWIDQGADWPEDPQSATGKGRNPRPAIPQHWAFVAPARPKPPSVKNRSWVRTPIDNFVLAQLEKQGLAPSPEADKVTLFRRLNLDLTGLPPAIEEVDLFLNDAGLDAYGKQVNRLLESPHYGERWGRWWLDAARYADTNGFEKDRARSIWPYRDWVIKAFNQDMPFDRFTIEQLAGDLLPQPTLDNQVATGFLRNSMLNQEGGVDPEQFRVEGVIDRVDAVGKAFLGLTISCAQCHNHKFDPIAQTEYYRFYAFLNNDDEPAIEVPDEKMAERRKEILSKIATIENDLIAGDADLPKRMSAWEIGVRNYETRWTPIKDGEIFAAFGVKFERLEDGSFVAKGDNATTNNYIVRAKTSLKKISGVRVEFLTDPHLPRGGPGRAPDGGFYFSEFSFEAAPLDKPDAVEKIALDNVTADFELPDSPAKNVIDGNFKTHWSSDAGPVRRNQNRQFVFETRGTIGYDNGAALTFQLAQKRDDSIDTEQRQPNIGRFRISVTDAPNPKADPLPASARRILSIPADQRSELQRREVFGFYRAIDPALVEANKKIDELMREWPYGPTTLALVPREIPRETRIFNRGDWKRPGDAVNPGVPAALHQFPKDAPPNRLGLAMWIVDKNNPLTARVIVNRIWQQYFGQGLVTTPEDFGSRCEHPSHPELLDWLAAEFIESGWSIKHIHRLIVNSAVYRQSSKVTPKLLEVDPYNRWLARAPRIRVESEIVRDVALAASGLLNRKIGGPSVFPPLPAGVMDLAYGGFRWDNATGMDRYRRGMYTFWKRTVPYPSMVAFDSPNGDFSCTRRVRSNTPLQALTTLNDTMFVEAAQALAIRIWKNGGSDDRSRMIHAFRLCVSREPDQFELRKLMELLDDQKKYFEGRTSAAVYVTAMDLNKIPEDVDLHKVAPWTMVARVLLNMDETITRE
ncbi:MAG TPA: PSD1 and planctomycete cytochrome C domain-containing protein [Blastocatellia bacterium]|nr:PSD1 and planctomycete cytochrome C domain-containing protein [Blastocatellia bacterium]